VRDVFVVREALSTPFIVMAVVVSFQYSPAASSYVTVDVDAITIECHAHDGGFIPPTQVVHADHNPAHAADVYTAIFYSYVFYYMRMSLIIKLKYF